MGRSGGGGGFGGGGFGGGFSSGGGGFGGSFSGGNRSGGRSAGDFGGSGHYGGGYSGGGGSWLGGFLWGSLLGGGRGQTVVVQQPNGGAGGSGGTGGPGGSPNPGNQSGGNNSGCSAGVIVIFIIIVVLLSALFVVGTASCSSLSVPASTVERTALPPGTAEVTAYYTDEDGDWIHNSHELEEGLRHFYDETGVWPYVYILPNGYTTSSSELADMAKQLYEEQFQDDAHFLLLFCDNGRGGYNCGYYGGQAARQVMDDEAVQILAAYLENNYNDYDLSEEEIFSRTFYDTADHIMSKTVSPAIPLAVIAAFIFVAVIIAIILLRRQQMKRMEAERMERILNTPLEQFGDSDLNDLEKKYESAPAATPAADPSDAAAVSAMPSVSSAQPAVAQPTQATSTESQASPAPPVGAPVIVDNSAAAEDKADKPE